MNARPLILRALVTGDLVDGLVVQRLSYSVNPWRIITAGGLEVAWEQESFVHPTSGSMLLEVCGYRTKRDASDALARLHETLEVWEQTGLT